MTTFQAWLLIVGVWLVALNGFILLCVLSSHWFGKSVDWTNRIVDPEPPTTWPKDTHVPHRPS